MKISFRRITSSGNFIPEIDGLRFIAIVSVVLFHLAGFLVAKDSHLYLDSIDYSLLKKYLSHGDLGVPLFFVISGFVLGLPFAKWYIKKGKPVNLKSYFIRRLTRIEPPYIVALSGVAFIAILVGVQPNLKTALSHYLASLFYIHNFIYPGFHIYPSFIGPAWSLEVEIQFYVLAPLLAFVFLSGSVLIRRSLLVLVIFLSLVISQSEIYSFRIVFYYLHFFLVGFLLADLYMCNTTIIPKTKFDSFIALVFFIIIWLFGQKDITETYRKFWWELIQLICIFFFYYYVLFHKVFRLLSLPIVTNIGGMCYSIYLLHYPLISIVGNPLMKYRFSDYSFINVSIYSIIILSIVMIGSSIFFLLIERPCMDKDWYKKIFKRKVLETKNNNS